MSGTRASVMKLLAIAVPTLVLDQLQKLWMVEMLYPDHMPPIIVTDFLSLVMVWNRGISFGMLNKPEFAAFAPYIILVGTLLILGLLTRLALHSASRIERVGYGLTIGGALGNVIDRLHYGAVADFFYFHLGDLGWPAFNLADSAICIGVFLLLLTQVRPTKVAP